MNTSSFNLARSQTNELKVGPRDDVVPRTWAICVVELDGDSQAGRSHRSSGVKPLEGLDEAPRRDGADLDLAWLEDAVTTNNAPSIVMGCNH